MMTVDTEHKAVIAAFFKKVPLIWNMAGRHGRQLLVLHAHTGSGRQGTYDQSANRGAVTERVRHQ